MTFRRYARCLALAAVLCASAAAQDAVTISVKAGERVGPWKPIWRYFGYDEPNYTYGKYGPQLLRELVALSPEPVYVRTHNLLTSGNGEPALKWGSTNAYTQDANGRPVYDWTIMDRIFDTYRETGVTPFVEIGFTPEALSTHPQPYQHTWPKGPLGTGWSYPPTDYAKWGELVYQWVRHAVDRYGRKEVESWYWEVWNEPDIFYWHGTPEEYFQLYDFAAAAVKRALPTARIGGPATTGPSARKAGDYLRQFLEHCTSGKNYATGATGCQLDFITYHAKGRLSLLDGHVHMDIAKQAADVDKGLEIISAFPKLKNLPIVLSESDPEGCAACTAREHPENAYRNGPLYAAYTAAMMKHIVDSSAKYGNHIDGMLTWAFEFEGQPYFDGFRSLATNGIDKPVLNFFRMAGLMHGDQVRVATVSSAAPTAAGQYAANQIDAIAVRSERELWVLVWNYGDDDVPGAASDVVVDVAGVPATAKRALLTQYRVDATHSNAYSAWREMGSPQDPTPEQRAKLVGDGQLQAFDSPRWLPLPTSNLKVTISLPRQSVHLLSVTW